MNWIGLCDSVQTFTSECLLNGLNVELKGTFWFSYDCIKKTAQYFIIKD